MTLRCPYYFKNCGFKKIGLESEKKQISTKERIFQRVLFVLLLELV